MKINLTLGFLKAVVIYRRLRLVLSSQPYKVGDKKAEEVRGKRL
tara:strand:+ start:2135 stop:2266 length:132 start_codon:yes stop_codon:yes gene_type:complete